MKLESTPGKEVGETIKQKPQSYMSKVHKNLKMDGFEKTIPQQSQNESKRFSKEMFMNVVNCLASSVLQLQTPASHILVYFLDIVVLPGCLLDCWDLAHLEGTGLMLK